MKSRVEIVRDVVHDFCVDFVEHPYRCYTEHGVHALLFAQLFNALPEGERFLRWNGHEMCAIQKEYCTAHDLGKSRRQHWDLAVLKAPRERAGADSRQRYDYMPLAAALEVGLNEPGKHLREDIRRLRHTDANIEEGFVLHLYRLSKPREKLSGRDWSCRSPRIVGVEQVMEMLAHLHESEAADRQVEVLYAVAGETGEHEKGLWLMRRGEAPIPLPGGITNFV